MKEGWDLFWNNKRFWLFYSLSALGWTTLALSWFWLPDSTVMGVIWSAIQGLIVILGAVWLIRKALRFYGKPRIRLIAAPLAVVGIAAPYGLIRWHPALTGVPMQTASLIIRFSAAVAIGVSAWLLLAALLATRSQSSEAPPALQTAPPNR
jgi:hypothetical protein